MLHFKFDDLTNTIFDSLLGDSSFAGYTAKLKDREETSTASLEF